jgi:hypothetical protein
MAAHWERAASVVPGLLLAALAAGCGVSMSDGGGGCGMVPQIDEKQLKAGEKEGQGGAGGSEEGGVQGYDENAYAKSLEGFGDDGKPTPARSARDAFASMARSLPPTKGSMAFIAAQLGPGAGTLDSRGDYVFNGENGGYVTIGQTAQGPVWRWRPNDSGHPSPDNEVTLPAPGAVAGGRSSEPGSGASPNSQRGPRVGCWPVPPPVRKINLRIHGGNGQRVVVDATPTTCSNRQEGYCQTVMGDQNRGCCPMRPEGDPMRAICEAAVMGPGPKWDYWGTGALLGHPGGNPYLVWASGVGTVRACSIVSGVCNSIQVPSGKEGGAAPETARPAPAPSGGGSRPVSVRVGGGPASMPAVPPSGPSAGPSSAPEMPSSYESFSGEPVDASTAPAAVDPAILR